ncbi:hypothetical protein [Streptomyces chrestomyceticus]|uniref:hypothetical protein n=1 Tax=Streptomyces chrestomyceticus TaxID=68185 RepID=UPI000F62111B|nr:hypothetical protein [Streptomyces chrestomyceticus]
MGLGLVMAGVVALSWASPSVIWRAGTARGVCAVALTVQALATSGFVLADAFSLFVVAACAAAGRGRPGQPPAPRSSPSSRPSTWSTDASANC